MAWAMMLDVALMITDWMVTDSMPILTFVVVSVG